MLLLTVLSSTARAQQCLASQYFNGQHCESCAPNCYCSVPNGCSKCLQGYTLDPSRTSCIQCPLASSGFAPCLSCCSHSSGTYLSCTDCDDSSSPGFVFLVGGRCLIRQGCFQIDSQGNCIRCLDMYYIAAGVCTACDASCLQCQGTDNCLTCNIGYFRGTGVAGALCQACSSGCQSCSSSSPGSCLKCLSGYFLLGGACQACSTGCSSCLDGAYCSTCMSGYLYLAGSCSLCTDTTVQGSLGCSSCINQYNFVYCTVCGAGYLLQAGQCVACSYLVPNSLLCSSNITATQCAGDFVATLTLRYYLLAGRCVLNSNSCYLVVNGLGGCLSCYTGYLLLPSGVCQQCSVAGCLTYSATDCTCSACKPQYYLSGTLCPACIANCKTCTASACSACLSGFYLLGGSCLACTASGCDTCPSNVCSACQQGLFLSGASCFYCPSSCSSCNSKLVCTGCASMYYLSGSGCLALASNCISYNGTQCTLCTHGFYPSQGICMACKGTSLLRCSQDCPLSLPLNVSRYLWGWGAGAWLLVAGVALS